MNTNTVISSALWASLRWFVRALMCLCLSFSTPSAFALESASYRLYDSFPNYGTSGTPDTSSSFLLNENGITWYALPAVSANYQIVTAPPAVSSSAASSVASQAASSVRTSPSGGRRPRPPVPSTHPSAEKRSSRSSASSSSRVAAVPSPASSAGSAGSAGEQIVMPVPCAPGEQPSAHCLVPLKPAAPCTGRACQCDRLWIFSGMCWAGRAPSAVPILGLLCAVLEVLLLLRILLHVHARSLPRRRR